MPIIKSNSSNPGPNLPRAIMLLGSWNSGKSFMSMTASKNYPPLPWQPFTPDRPKPVDFVPVNLDDVFVHAWEPDCFSGFHDAGLATPPHWDLAAVSSGELDLAIDAVNAETLSRVKKGITEVVVVDTLSAFNTMNHAKSAFGAVKNEDAEESTKTTETNMQKVWAGVLNRHIRYLNGLLAAGPRLLILNVHPKVNDPSYRGMGQDSKGKSVHQANMKARGLNSDTATIAPEITGSAFNQYMRNCSLVMYIESEQKNAPLPGKPGQFFKQTTRWVNPHKKDDVLARSKYATLSEKEPADLRAIFEKIKGENK